MWSSPGLTVMIRHWPLNDRGKSRDLNLASDCQQNLLRKFLKITKLLTSHLLSSGVFNIVIKTKELIFLVKIKINLFRTSSGYDVQFLTVVNSLWLIMGLPPLGLCRPPVLTTHRSD